MVFSRFCSAPEKLGTALAVPARTECETPDQLIEEAEYLWAAECDSSECNGITAGYGRVCLLCNPARAVPHIFVNAWQEKVAAAGRLYRAVPAPREEDSILNPHSGLAQIDWPTDTETQHGPSDFDLLLMTATEPTLIDGRFASVNDVAQAWRNDTESHVSYFYNNRKHGITTFEDALILAVLRGEPPIPVLDQPA